MKERITCIKQRHLRVMGFFFYVRFVENSIPDLN